jgi:hypothetical protein
LRTDTPSSQHRPDIPNAAGENGMSILNLWSVSAGEPHDIETFPSYVVREEAHGIRAAMILRQRPTSLTAYTEKVLKPDLDWFLDLIAIHHCATSGMASELILTLK